LRVGSLSRERELSVENAVVWIRRNIGGHGDTPQPVRELAKLSPNPGLFASSTMTFRPNRSRCLATTAVVNPNGVPNPDDRSRSVEIGACWDGHPVSCVVLAFDDSMGSAEVRHSGSPTAGGPDRAVRGRGREAEQDTLRHWL
jgi:hypothetical protein